MDYFIQKIFVQLLKFVAHPEKLHYLTVESALGLAFGLAKTLQGSFGRCLHLVKVACNNVVFVGALRAGAL